MRKLFALSILLSLQVLWAQSPSLRSQSELGNTQLDRRFQEQIIEKWVLGPDTNKQISNRQVADAQVRDFYTRAQRFVNLWQSFANDLNGGKTFNVKLAKQVSKAFHDLEKSEGWPVVRSK